MGDGFGRRFFSKVGIVILAIALVDLAYLNWWLISDQKKLKPLETQGEAREIAVEPSAEPIIVTSPSPTPVAIESNKETVVVKTEEKTSATATGGTTIIQTAQKEIFIPLGSGQTKSASFADLPGMEVTIDTTKYSNIDSVVFEASLWTEGGNGMAWAQFKNSTDNNPLIESRITGVSTNGILKTSGNIPWPSGSKKYVVQAKTDIDNFAAHVDNARLKITLK